jgi:hypothetical protein
MYNIGYPQMSKMPAVCKRQDEGYRKRAAGEDVLKEDCGLVCDAYADCCVRQKDWLQERIAANGK